MRCNCPGVSPIWTMPIINRIDMLTTGIRSEVGVKVFGSDLVRLEGLAREVADVVRTVPGASNVYPEQVTSGQYLNIEVDRGAAARYGIGVGVVQQTIETAVGETVLTTTIEGRARFPVRVRYRQEDRVDPAALGQVLVAAPNGAQIPLGQLARIEHARGPAMISSENGLLLATVLLNVQDRDVGGFVDDARATVAREVNVPPGYYIAWSGQWENEARARARLQLVVPIVLAIIFVLLYVTYGSALDAAHVLLAVPFALTGGVYLLWALDYHFSVAVWVGFIALVRDGRADGCRDGHLSRRSGRSEASRARRGAHAGGAARRRRGGSTPAAAPQSDDGLHGRRGAAAHHVEHQRRR